MKPEQMLALRVANFIAKEFPTIIYRYDLAADLKLTIGQAKRNNQLNRVPKYPDMFLAEPRGDMHGYFIELKVKYSDVYKKDGNYKKNDHILKQAITLSRLRARGYKAEFSIGYEETVTRIRNYLKDSK